MALVSIAVLAMPAVANAFGSAGGTEVDTGTAPANGQFLTTTDAIPANATQGSFGVQPLPGTDPHEFDAITSVLVEDFPSLGKLSQRGQATVACILMSYLPLAYSLDDHIYTYEDVRLQLVLLNVCLQMALSIPKAEPDSAGVASARCGQATRALSVKISHSHAGYKAVVVGNARPTRRPALTVTCRRSGRGLLLMVRPRKRGQTLRQAGASTLAIAYRNPTSRPVGIRTTFKVN